MGRRPRAAGSPRRRCASRSRSGRYRTRAMRTLAILPIKSFAQAKQRLRHELSPAAGVRSSRRCSPTCWWRCGASSARARSSSSAAIARPSGSPAATGPRSSRTTSGVTTRRPKGIDAALEAGIERVLLVPGDCPLLDPEELDELLVRPAGEPLGADRARPARHRHERAAADAAGCARAVLRPGQLRAPRGRCRGGRHGCGGRRGPDAGARRRHPRGPRGAAATPRRKSAAAPRTRAAC